MIALHVAFMQTNKKWPIFWSIMKVNGILPFFRIFDFDPYHRLFQIVINCDKQNEQILFDDKGY